MSSVAIASRSFSKHPVLRKEVLRLYPDAKFNDEGLALFGDSLVNFLSGYDKAITALEVIDDTILSRLPNLKVIGKYGVGLDMIDLYSMKKHGVKLGWVGGTNKRFQLLCCIALYMRIQRLEMASGIKLKVDNCPTARWVLLGVAMLVKISLNY